MADDEGLDGVDQAARNAMRAAVMAAAVAAEQVVRQVRAHRERERLQSGQRGELLRHRYDAERQLARTALAGADDRWVRGAEVDDVTRLVATTKAWSDLEPVEFGPRLEQLREQVAQTRDDADVVLNSTPAAATAPADGARQELDAADQAGSAMVAGGAAADARADVAEAAAAEAGAAGVLEEPAYDSSSRRAELYRRAVDGGAEEGVAAGRVLASTAQAAPVAAAVGQDAAPVSRRGAAAASTAHERSVTRTRGSAVER